MIAQTLSGRAVDLEAAAQRSRYQVEHDVRPQTAAALPAPGREEGIEQLRQRGRVHPGTVIAIVEQHRVAIEPHRNRDASRDARLKAMDQRVHHQVGDDLRHRAREAFQFDVVGALQVHRDRPSFELGLERQQHFGQIGFEPEPADVVG